MFSKMWVGVTKSKTSKMRVQVCENILRLAPVASIVFTTITICWSVFSIGEEEQNVSNEKVNFSISRVLTLLDEDEPLPPLFPFQTKDYLGYGFAILGLLLAAGGGIGGGGILVPIYILILDFPVKHAIPLASSTVLGGSIANNILNAPKRHPNHPRRPLIDWDLILQLEPMTILGALFGAVMNDYMPDIVLVVMMVILLTLTAQKTLSKANALYQKESELLKAQNSSEIMPLLGRIADEPTDMESSCESNSQDDDEKLEKHVPKSGEDDCGREALIDSLKLSILFVAITILNLLKGEHGESGGGPMGLNSCGAACFWAANIAMVAIITVFAVYVRWYILKRLKSGGPVLSDIEWDESNTVIYPAYAIVAGLVAGLFGVGGGIIKGPLMLALGEYK